MAFGNFLTQFDERLRSLGPVVYAEDSNAMKIFEVPTYTVSLLKWKGNGYVSQRDMEKSYYLEIVGSMSKKGLDDGSTENQWTLEDELILLDFSERSMSKIYNIHNEMQDGTFTSNGLVQLGQFPEVWHNLDLAPRLLQFIANIEVIFINQDSEV